jgi:hypothetical protein
MSGYAPRLPFAAQLDPAAAVRRCRTTLQPFSVAALQPAASLATVLQPTPARALTLPCSPTLRTLCPPLPRTLRTYVVSISRKVKKPSSAGGCQLQESS